MKVRAVAARIDFATMRARMRLGGPVHGSCGDIAAHRQLLEWQSAGQAHLEVSLAAHQVDPIECHLWGWPGRRAPLDLVSLARLQTWDQLVRAGATLVVSCPTLAHQLLQRLAQPPTEGPPGAPNPT